MLTQHNDNFRSGATLAETVLTTANVRPGQFGKLYTREVDGEIYAQPLYVEGVDVPGKGKRNVVFVATMKNNLYAFDADDDDPAPAAGLVWGPIHLGTPEQGRIDTDGNPPPQPSCPSAAYYGITSTPVIDPAHGWMFVVAKTIDGSGQPHQMLHRIDIRSGAGANPNPQNRPTEILTGVSEQVFSQQLNRAGLLLSSGNIYVAFAGHCDFPFDGTPSGSYHGWVLSYDSITLAKRGQFNTTPEGFRGGIWQSGNGLASDRRGNVYFQTGNKYDLGERVSERAATDLNESVIRLGPNLAGPVVFPPPNAPPPPYLDYRRLDAEDLDITSSGPLLIPEPGNGDLITGGKTGRLYLLDRADMALKQTFRAAVNNSNPAIGPEDCTYGVPDSDHACPHIHSGPVYWHGPEPDFARIYVWTERDYLRAYRYSFASGLILRSDGTPIAAPPALNLDGPNQSVHGADLIPLADSYDHIRVMPGGTLSVSANGSKSDTGIVWATQVLRDNAEYKNVPGILRAYDAITLQELWNSGAYQFDPDFLGKHAKYAPVTIAGGRVFAPTNSNRLVVYGLLGHARRFTAPWQDWIDLGEAKPRGEGVIPANAAVTPLARSADVLDTFLVDRNGTVLDGGYLIRGGQYFWGYPLPRSVRQPTAVTGSVVTAKARTADLIDLFATLSDGSVWNVANWALGSTGPGPFGWHGGYPIPGAGSGYAVPGTPVGALNRSDHIADLFVVRADGSVWNAGHWADGQPGPGPFGWNAGYPIPGAGPGFARPGSAVTVISRAAGLVDLFVTRADGSIWNAGHWADGQPGPGPFGWNAGYPISGAGQGFAEPGTTVAAISRTPDVVDLFVARADGSIWNAGHWDGGQPGPGPFGWNAGYPIPDAGRGFARPGAPVAAISRASDVVDLYVTRPDGSVWNAGYRLGSSPGPGAFGWNPGYRIGLGRSVDTTAPVAGVARGAGHVDLFVPGKDGQIFSPWWDAAAR